MTARQAVASVKAPPRPRVRGEAAAVLARRFPPRVVPPRWEATGWSRDLVMARLLAPPFAVGEQTSMRRRRHGLVRILDWLGQFRGDTWQQRWLACGIAEDARFDWRPGVARWLVQSGHVAAGTARLQTSVTSGLGQLIYADVIRPGLPWLLSSPVRYPFGHEIPGSATAAVSRHSALMPPRRVPVSTPDEERSNRYRRSSRLRVG